MSDARSVASGWEIHCPWKAVQRIPVSAPRQSLLMRFRSNASLLSSVAFWAARTLRHQTNEVSSRAISRPSEVRSVVGEFP